MQRSPVGMFRSGGQRRTKKRGGRPVEDSAYERPSSPLLGFGSPQMHGRRRMVHAKSCDMTPMRLQLQSGGGQGDPDTESHSSDESWDVEAVDLKENASSCQVVCLA